METRTHKKTGDKLSLLGFGMMRLPKVDPDKQDIDYAAAEEMVEYAFQNGVNYFDTAYPYHEGMSELFTGHALAKYPRDSFYLATKMPSWHLAKEEDAPRIFAEQLDKLKVEYFDYYLCHAIGRSLDDFKSKYIDTKALEYLRQEKAKGRIRHLGFSFHGEVSVLEELVDYCDWDFCQIQLNYLDWDVQNAKRQYEILEEKGIPCIVMEPVRGGNLVTLCEESVNILKAAEPDDSVASWGIRFAATLPNVITVLSGMSNLEQVKDNVKTMTGFKPLDDDSLNTLQQALTAYLNTGTIPCTGCRYCMDCPSGVDIPAVFELYNRCATEHKLPVSFGDKQAQQESAKDFIAIYGSLPAENRAKHCTNCKACLEHCPQSIEIPKKLREIASLAQTFSL
ncbi:aldo/keto reductase [Ruminococcaceae bacterium OttesenSCG-928-L11]|nr:aldo/keto reductase [Ruminococcaceae bacterium OttesenSCG-928-L11]